MNFGDRLRRAATPAQLDHLMMQIRSHGSSRWTLKAAKDRVVRKLWPTLERHFAEDGSILGWQDEDEGNARPTPEDTVLATIQALEQRLEAARQAAGEKHRKQAQHPPG